MGTQWKLRDLRGLMRSRLARYGLPKEFGGDLFGSGEAAIHCREESTAALPQHSRFAIEQELDLLRCVEESIATVTEEIAGSVGKLGWVRRLRTLLGEGEILGPTICLEIGQGERFATPAHLV